MPRGGPDYGNPVYQVASQQQDTGDLIVAARGINTCDGRGRLMYLDTFLDGLGAWRATQSGGASLAAVVTNVAEISPVCMLLNTFGGAVGDYSQIARSWRIAGIRHVGLELGIKYDGGMADLIVSFQLRTLDGYAYGQMKLTNDGKLYLFNAAFAYQLVDTLAASGESNTWLPVKLVIGNDPLTYVRLIVGQREINISSVVIYTPVPSTIEDLYVAIQAINVSAGKSKIYIGHVLMTVDEP
jgi:hypothetical protein